MVKIKQKINILKKTGLLGEIFMMLALMVLVSVGGAKASEISPEKVIELVNEARMAANIKAVENNASLQLAAEKKAQDMIDNNYFAHVSPQGKTPWIFIEAEGYNYRFAGENLAINFTDAARQQKAWMDSALHRKNILNKNYTETGVAVKRGFIEGRQTTVTVQEFGRQMSDVLSAEAAAQESSLESESNLPSADNASIAGSILSKERAEKFISDNPLTVKIWLLVAGLVVLMFAGDVIALLHKKHTRFFILHGARKKT